MTTEQELAELRREVEAQRLRAESASLRSITEATDSINGTPIDWRALLSYNGESLRPLYSAETRPTKNTTLRSLKQLHQARNDSRFLYETNGNGQAIVRTMKSYVVGAGSKVSVVAPEDEDEPPVRLAKRIRYILRMFRRVNCWYFLELELVERMIVDGEFFIRVFPDEDNITKVRFVEPAQIIPPEGEDAEGDWSYGIYTPGGDVQRPQAYNVHDYVTGEDEQVEPQFIIHAKFNCLQNQKRGVPGFFACYDELAGSQKLRYATREGEKIRQSIAYFREHAVASPATIQALQNNAISQVLTRSTPEGSRDVNIQHVDPGTVIDQPKGLQVKDPPASRNASAADTTVTMSLQAAAARFNVPLWAVAGSGQDINFATALTEESPFTKSVSSHQAILAWVVDCLHTAVIDIAAEQGQLGYEGEWQEVADLQVVYPSPQVRNKKEETDRRALLNERGVLSRRTWSGQEELEFEGEQANLESEGPAISAGQAPLVTPAPPSNATGAEYQREVNR